jgi:hypothetical protein
VTAKQLFEQAGMELACRNITASLRLYDLAVQAGFDPDQCAAGRWECYMLTGHFELAWRESDSIAQRGQPDPHRFWDGQSFAGRQVLLRCLHGLGDTLQFVRYAPLIRSQSRSLTIEAQPKLQALLRQADLADCVITWGEPEPSWDQQVEVMELPRIFRTQLDTVPCRVPYIPPRGAQNARLRATLQQRNSADPRVAQEPDLSDPLRVGIVWASSTFNPARSVPLGTLAPLFKTPGVSFLSLQADDEGLEASPWASLVVQLPVEHRHILATANTLANLHLLITVDTMTAHLAGAMGIPVWTLLPFTCDWRWMLGRSDSPWYPTMRLFRQPKPEDWPSVIAEVQRELLSLTAAQSPCQSPAHPAPPLVLAP